MDLVFPKMKTYIPATMLPTNASVVGRMRWQNRRQIIIITTTITKTINIILTYQYHGDSGTIARTSLGRVTKMER